MHAEDEDANEDKNADEAQPAPGTEQEEASVDPTNNADNQGEAEEAQDKDANQTDVKDKNAENKKGTTRNRDNNNNRAANNDKTNKRQP